MPSLFDLGRRYIWGKTELSSESEDVSKVQRTVLKQVSPRKSYFTGDVKLETLRRAATSEPLFYKAMFKKNLDTIRSWFIVKHKDEKKKVPEEVLDLIYKFDKRTLFSSKLVTSGVCSNIYGNGYLERTFIESGNVSLDSPVKKGSEPLGLIPMNSEFITSIEKHPSKKDDDNLYYVYQESASQKIYIHPDRVLNVAIDKLPFSKFGISKVHVLYKTLQSKISSDTASGEILAWFGHGILDMTINNMNDIQEKAAVKLYKEHLDYYVHDEDYEMKIHNPTQIDPKPFYEYFYCNIAAAFVMPTHILVGQQVGNVTGSEIGISDYYNDIENIQEIIFTPLIEKVYRQLLSSHGYSWDYVIDWNQVYVDELSEANILMRRGNAASIVRNAGLIDIPEGREIINEGVINLDVNKIPKEPEEINPPIGVEPAQDPQPPIKKPTVKSKWVKLSEEQMRMIRERGKQEEIEQEKRLKEAGKKNVDKTRNTRR